MYQNAVLFGGSGFIGSHLADHLLRSGVASRVVLADLRPPSELAPKTEKVSFVSVDVRRPIDSALFQQSPDLIVNLAAVHREPGHSADEYFETNVRGAENVSAYAAEVACAAIVFTSSISVYGPSETEKDEQALPVPVTPYGSSKLLAERIHRHWQETNSDRKLVIVRPGVIFGAGESGNVTRLVHAVTQGYFVFCGNHHVRKAGGYVRELCASIVWALDRTKPGSSLLYNFTDDPTPTLDEFVRAVANAAGTKVTSLSVPFLPVLGVSYAVQALSSLVGISQPLHPVRVRKLVRSNHISATVLRQLGYRRTFDLEAGLEDWKRVRPSDWGITAY